MKHDYNLTFYLEKALPPAEMERTEAHLKVCSECREDLALLEKSSRVIAESLCPDTDDLIRIVASGIESDRGDALRLHLKSCSRCREAVESLSEALETKVEVPARGQWLPLPDDVGQQLILPGGFFRERLRALKAGFGDDIDAFIDQAGQLLDRLFSPGSEQAPSYAMEREITMPVQTDLELRAPRTPSKIQFQIEDFHIEIRTELSEMRIKVTREGRAVSGADIQVLIDGVERVVHTDEQGEALLKSGDSLNL